MNLWTALWILILVLCLHLTAQLACAHMHDSIPGQNVEYQNLNFASRFHYFPNETWKRGKKQSNLLTLEGEAVVDQVLTLKSLGHFDRERIPERVVHAKGSTFYGTFRVTNSEVSRYTKASIFSKVNKRTRVAARFSTSLSERGSADTVFGEVRGLAVKFYSEPTNYDLLSINLPVFFINDPQMFVQMTHAQKRDPRSNLNNGDNLWDFYTLRPETFNAITFLYSPFGLPFGFVHMSAFSVNVFRLSNDNDEYHYAKFIWLPEQGVRYLNLSQSIQISGEDPDYARRELFYSIENKRPLSWKLYMQVITVEEVQSGFSYNPFDATKLWPFDRYPLMEVGIMTLTHNVQNFFAESEQIALNPANLIPGIEPSPDRLLRGRLFAYRDTQFYRLGANHLQIPVNRDARPVRSERDGLTRSDGNLGSVLNYYPNSNPKSSPEQYDIARSPFAFLPEEIALEFSDSVQNQYHHARQTYLSFSESEKDILFQNMAYVLNQVSQGDIVSRVLKHLHNICPTYAKGVEAQLLQSY